MKWPHHLEVIMEPAMKLADRFQDIGAAKAVIVVIAAGIQAVITDLFGGMLLLMVVFAAIDTMYGRRVAHARHQFDQLEAEKGLHSKVIGILLACAVRWFEWWFAQQDVFQHFDTRGALATAIAALLFAADLESINQHRIRFGRGPVPLIGTALEWIRTVAERLGGRPRDSELRRRKEDDQG